VKFTNLKYALLLGWFATPTTIFNPFFLLLKLPQNKKTGLVWHFGFLWLGTIGFLIVVIENQQENRMVKQWVQPPINKNRLPPGGFLLGSHLTSFIFIFIC